MKKPREILLEKHHRIDKKLDRIRNDSVRVIRDGSYLEANELRAAEASLGDIIHTFWIRSLRPVWLTMAGAWVAMLVLQGMVIVTEESGVGAVTDLPESELRERLQAQRELLAEFVGNQEGLHELEDGMANSDSPGPRSQVPTRDRDLAPSKGMTRL